MNDYKLVKYDNNGVNIDVRIDEENNTIWLTQSEIASVLNSTVNAVSKNIKKLEKDDSVIACQANTEVIGSDGKAYKSKLYNLVMIEEISRRSKSNSGYGFIKWANDILKSNNKLSIAEFSPNEAIKSKIYDVRNTKVMLDFELAELYGYSTGAFNQQVQRNIEKFPSDFMFQLSESELISILKSQIVISSWGGNRKLPYAFTEQGIYMLMTVLKGELATNQSIIIIRTFKAMKDYIVETNNLSNSKEILNLQTNRELLKLANNINENTKAISMMNDEIKKIKEKQSKSDLKLEEVMDNFIDPSTYKHFVFFKGERIESDIAYQNIYSMAKHSIYIIDDYISLKTLQLLKGVDKKIKIIIFSDNKDKSGLSSLLFNDFVKDTNLNITLLHNNTYHDRYVVIDYGYKNEIIYHSGASSKDGGNSGYEIDESEYPQDHDLRIANMLKNDILILK